MIRRNAQLLRGSASAPMRSVYISLCLFLPFSLSVYGLVAAVLSLELHADIALQMESPDEFAVAASLAAHVLRSHTEAADAAELLAGESLRGAASSAGQLGALPSTCACPATSGLGLAVVGRILHVDQGVEGNVLPHDLQVVRSGVQLYGIVVHLQQILCNALEGFEHLHALLLQALALCSGLLAVALLLH